MSKFPSLCPKYQIPHEKWEPIFLKIWEIQIYSGSDTYTVNLIENVKVEQNEILVYLENKSWLDSVETVYFHNNLKNLNNNLDILIYTYNKRGEVVNPELYENYELEKFDEKNGEIIFRQNR